MGSGHKDTCQGTQGHGGKRRHGDTGRCWGQGDGHMRCHGDMRAWGHGDEGPSHGAQGQRDTSGGCGDMGTHPMDMSQGRGQGDVGTGGPGDKGHEVVGTRGQGDKGTQAQGAMTGPRWPPGHLPTQGGNSMPQGKGGGGGCDLWGGGSVTLSPLLQVTVGAGSPEMGTSRRSLLPATTTMVLSDACPEQSRWILGGSGEGHRGHGGWGHGAGTALPPRCHPRPALSALTLLGDVLDLDLCRERRINGGVSPIPPSDVTVPKMGPECHCPPPKCPQGACVPLAPQ